MDSTDVSRAEHAYKAIFTPPGELQPGYTNHFALCQRNAQSEGPGMSVFRMKKFAKDNESNCDYGYVLRDTPMWTRLFELVPCSSKIKEAYDPNSMFCTCILVPMEGKETSYLGLITLFTYDTFTNVTPEYETNTK